MPPHKNATSLRTTPRMEEHEMAAKGTRSTFQSTPASPVIDKDAIKLRLDCANIVSRLQTGGMRAAGLTKMAETLFQYVQTGKIAEKAE